MKTENTPTADAAVLAGMVMRHESFVLKAPRAGLIMRANYMLRRLRVGDIAGYLGYSETLALSIGQVTSEPVWGINPHTKHLGYKYTLCTIPRYKSDEGYETVVFSARVFCIFNILTKDELKRLDNY